MTSTRGYASNRPSLHTTVRKSAPHRTVSGARAVPRHNGDYTYRASTRNWPLVIALIIGLAIFGLALMPHIADLVGSFQTVGDVLDTTSTTAPTGP